MIQLMPGYHVKGRKNCDLKFIVDKNTSSEELRSNLIQVQLFRFFNK